MKKYLLTVIILITAVSFSNLNAQVKGGYKMGVDFSNFKDQDAKRLIAPRIGFLLEVGINDFLFAQTGAYYNVKGFRGDGVRYIEGLKFDSKEYQILMAIDFPVNFGYKYDLGGAKLFAMVGPVISWNLYATELYSINGAFNNSHQTVGNDENVDTFKPIAFGANIEGGIEVNRFLFSVFYSMSLSDYSPQSADLKPNLFGITTGIKFGKVDDGRRHSRHKRYRRR